MKVKDALIQFLETIEATGGLISLSDGTHGCVADEEWVDLATAALDAQAALACEGVAFTLTIDGKKLTLFTGMGERP